MKLKYVEYLGDLDKEFAIAKALKDLGEEGIRLFPTKRSVKKHEYIHNATTLHEYILRKTNVKDGVIIVEDAKMYPDAIIGTFIMSLNKDDVVLLIHDFYQIMNDNKIIQQIKDAGGILEFQ